MENKAQVATDYLIMLSFVLSLGLAISAIVVHLINLSLNMERETSEIRRKLLQGGN
ncbi:MAG: hypothetical protein N3F05_00070 [Candidatus Diapherotrites archaeon]|nr:hypothetical protein [Candidatus Diapherotrites archaeon]